MGYHRKKLDSDFFTSPLQVFMHKDNIQEEQKNIQEKFFSSPGWWVTALSLFWSRGASVPLSSSWFFTGLFQYVHASCTGGSGTGCSTPDWSHQGWVEEKDLFPWPASCALPFSVHKVIGLPYIRIKKYPLLPKKATQKAWCAPSSLCCWEKALLDVIFFFQGWWLHAWVINIAVNPPGDDRHILQRSVHSLPGYYRINGQKESKSEIQSYCKVLDRGDWSVCTFS